MAFPPLLEDITPEMEQAQELLNQDQTFLTQLGFTLTPRLRHWILTNPAAMNILYRQFRNLYIHSRDLSDAYIEALYHQALKQLRRGTTDIYGTVDVFLEEMRRFTGTTNRYHHQLSQIRTSILQIELHLQNQHFWATITPYLQSLEQLHRPLYWRYSNLVKAHVTLICRELLETNQVKAAHYLYQLAILAIPGYRKDDLDKDIRLTMHLAHIDNRNPDPLD